MAEYIVLVQGNVKNFAAPEEWKAFFTAARQSGLFQGGSEIGDRMMIGDTESAKPTDHIVGYLRFDADDRQEILKLLKVHPVVVHGGSVELCELPES